MNISSQINTDNILLYKIQKYIPFFTLSINTISLIIHSTIAVVSYILYGYIIIFIIKNRKKKVYNSFFYHCIILNGFVDISFHIDNFFTSILLCYEPYLMHVAPTQPSYWYSFLYYAGFFFAQFLYYNTFIISINRVTILLSPLKATNIFEKNIKLLTTLGILISGIPHIYLLFTPAYFSVTSSIYTNNKKIGTFANVMWKGYETMPLNIIAIYCGFFTIATFLVNLFIIYLLVKRSNKKNINSDTKMTIYGILLFISQMTYTSMLYVGYFTNMNLEDKTIIYIFKIMRPWCFNILCLFAPYSLFVFNTNIRNMIFKKIHSFSIKKN
uniref:Serpentine receptor class gamma n=1 Tax=Strongyloides stercoralis TaxID=6248 RepID=A0A0K0DXX8_STRER